MTQAAIDHPTLHPVFAGLIDTLSQQPVQLRRAEYVARLIRMDWRHEFSDCGATARKGRAELAALTALRSELDADNALWMRHAPEWAWPSVPVHTFTDFAGDCPVTVEWVRTINGPRLIAVVVDVKGVGPKRIDRALNPALMDRLYKLVSEVSA